MFSPQRRHQVRGESLDNALAKVGLRSEPAKGHGYRAIHVKDRSGKTLFTGTVYRARLWLRDTWGVGQ